MFKRGDNKKGQVTIFIIIAIVIVASVSGYFIFKNISEKEVIPESISPIQSSFLSCIEQVTLTGITLLESSGGYIELPEFEAGSRYMPTSSQLSFAGREIPYWFYVSGSNTPSFQVPTKAEMEYQLERYIEGRVGDCRFDSYVEEGFLIVKGIPFSEVKIKEGSVEVDLEMNLDISRGEEVFLMNEHGVEINSNLGKLYSAAREVYELEQEDLFLENYSIDVLRLYAPVDGVELSCSPEVWGADKVFSDLKEALEINTMALKNKGDRKDYFVVEELPQNVDVNFMNSRDWPMYLEVNPAQGNSLIAEPVGNQQGLGLLGFCYVPYHFVYDVRYPVLVQVSEGNEIFQFPMVVMIENNLPRKDDFGGEIEDSILDLCEDKNSFTTINVYDSNLDSVDASIRYDCFGSSCNIGETVNGEIKDYFPQCVNGQLVVQAEGYRDSSIPYSSVNQGNVVTILDKEYEKDISLFLDGSKYSGEAIISFSSEGFSETVVYPEDKTVSLSEGIYEIIVSIYSETELNFGESIQEQCVKVPISGIGSIFGIEREECFEVEVPEQLISSALVGGGQEERFFLENELRGESELIIEATKLKTPETVEELQENYILFEVSSLEVRFR